MPKFTLKTSVENLDDVPVAYRERYKQNETDKKYYLEEIEIDDGAEVKTALERAKEERRQAKADLEKYKDLDPEKAREALAKLGELEDKKLVDKGEYDRLLEKRTNEFNAEKSKLEDQLKSLNGEVRKFKLDDKVRAAALEAGVFPEDLDDVLTITSRRFDLDEKGRIVVLDDEGDETSLTLEKFFGESFREQKPKFYKPSESGGSGAPPGKSSTTTGSTRTVKATDQSALNDNLEKIASGEIAVD